MTATVKTGGTRRAALPMRSRACSVGIAETASAYPNAYRTPTRPQFMRSQFGRVDLRALQASAEVDVHRLPFREHVERRGSGFAVSVACRFRSAEREMDLGANRRRVHVEDARVKIAHRRERLVDVLRVNRRRQSVLDVVADG